MSAHERLRIWKDGQSLACAVYALTSRFPKHELWGLTGQMRRSAVSVPANIAEGASRGSSKELKQFVIIARGSLSELQSYLDLAQRLGYANAEEIRPAWEQCRGVERGINALLASLMRGLP